MKKNNKTKFQTFFDVIDKDNGASDDYFFNRAIY